MQLWTDSSVEDFRGPSGEGSRLLFDGDGERRLLFPGGGNEPLRQSSSTSALPTSLKPVSDGRTRMGGTVRSPVLGACAGLTLPQLGETAKLVNVPYLLLIPSSGHKPAAAEPESAPSKSASLWWWRLPTFSAGKLKTGRPSREMLLRNKRAACLRREFSRFLRLCSLFVCGFLPLTAVIAALCWPQAAAAAAAAMVSVPLRKSAGGSSRDLQLSNPFYPARDRFTPSAAPHWLRRECVMTYIPRASGGSATL